MKNIPATAWRPDGVGWGGEKQCSSRTWEARWAAAALIPRETGHELVMMAGMDKVPHTGITDPIQRKKNGFQSIGNLFVGLKLS